MEPIDRNPKNEAPAPASANTPPLASKLRLFIVSTVAALKAAIETEYGSAEAPPPVTIQIVQEFAPTAAPKASPTKSKRNAEETPWFPAPSEKQA